MNDKLAVDRDKEVSEITTLQEHAPLIEQDKKGAIRVNPQTIDSIRYGRVPDNEAALIMRDGLQTVVENVAAGVKPTNLQRMMQEMMAADPTHKLVLRALEGVEDVEVRSGGRTRTYGIAVITERLPVSTTLALGMPDLETCSPRRLATYLRYLGGRLYQSGYVHNQSRDLADAEKTQSDLFDMEEKCFRFAERVGERAEDSDTLAEDLAEALFVGSDGEPTVPGRAVLELLDRLAEESDLFAEVVELVDDRYADLGIRRPVRDLRNAEQDTQDLDGWGFQLE